MLDQFSMLSIWFSSFFLEVYIQVFLILNGWLSNGYSKFIKIQQFRHQPFKILSILISIEEISLLTLIRRCWDFRNRNGCGAPPGGCNGTPGSGITCCTGRFTFNANFFKQATRFSHINDTSSIRCNTYKCVFVKME